MFFVKVDQDKKQAVVESLNSNRVPFEDHPDGIQLYPGTTLSSLVYALKPLNMRIKVSLNA